MQGAKIRKTDLFMLLAVLKAKAILEINTVGLNKFLQQNSEKPL